MINTVMKRLDFRLHCQGAPDGIAQPGNPAEASGGRGGWRPGLEGLAGVSEPLLSRLRFREKIRMGRKGTLRQKAAHRNGATREATREVLTQPLCKCPAVISRTLDRA